MISRPPLLQIPGRHPALLVAPEDDAKVIFYLRGMGIDFRRKPGPGGITQYELPNMLASNIQRMIVALMRDY